MQIDDAMVSRGRRVALSSAKTGWIAPTLARGRYNRRDEWIAKIYAYNVNA